MGEFLEWIRSTIPVPKNNRDYRTPIKKTDSAAEHDRDCCSEISDFSEEGVLETELVKLTPQELNKLKRYVNELRKM